MHVGEKNDSKRKMKDLRGKSPEVGDFFPSIPRSNKSSNISHVIKEIFQDYIKDDLPSYDSAKAMQVTCEENPTLRTYADSVVEIYENHDRSIKDIASIEEQMMRKHANYILKKDKIQKNVLLSNIVELKQNRILSPIDKKDLCKYPLIEADDIFASEAQETLDLQKYEDGLRKFLKFKDTSYTPEFDAQLDQDTSNSYLKWCVRKKSELLHPVRMPLEIKKVVKTKQKENLLRVVPNQITFTACERGQMYKEGILIQNIGKKVARMQVLPFNDSSFKVQWSEKIGGIIEVAPGLSVTAKVEFDCATLDDTNDTLILKVEGGQDVLIPASSKRYPPVLEANESEEMSFYPVLWSVEKKGVEATLECGISLVGEKQFQMIKLLNSGGEGHFWVMTEDEWVQCRIKNGFWNNILKFPPFTLMPYYFKLKSNDEITLCFLYEPKTYGLQIERLIILCDNCVLHTLDILADAVFFESRFISFASLKKTFNIEIDEDLFADYYLNIGRILPKGSTQKTFFLNNESDLDFQFYWKKRCIKFPDVHMNPPYTLNQLPLECINVTPSEGMIPARSDQHFIVKCSMHNGECGHYRAVISFFIEDLPWQSITHDSNVRRVMVNPKNGGKVDVLLNEIELWVECVPLAVMLQPCILKITSAKLRCNEEPVLPKVILANTTLDDIIFNWLPIKSLLDKEPIENPIEILEKSGSVKAKSFMPCPLKIIPVSEGLLIQEVRCSVDDGEKLVEMLVCAQVAEPQITPSKFMLNFGSVKKNSIRSQQLKISNDSKATVVWMAREFKYDFSSGNLRPMAKTGLSCDSGFFTHSDSVCTVSYSLNSKDSGIWISVIELSVVSHSHRYRQHFILVVADIQEPCLTLCAPPKLTALLCLGNPVFLGVPVVTHVVLRNNSYVLCSFKWGVPLGKDVPNLCLDIRPRSGVIKSMQSELIEVLIIPQMLGRVTNYYIPCFFEECQEPIILGIRCKVEGISVNFVLPAVMEKDQETPLFVYIPWSGNDKSEHPFEMETSLVTEDIKWPIFDQDDVKLNVFKEIDVFGFTTRKYKPKLESISEVIINDVDYNSSVNESLTQDNEQTEIEDESNNENEDIILDGKIGKLYVENSCRLVLHFKLWESSNIMQIHYYENLPQTDNELVEDDNENIEEEVPDMEVTPFHTYPLAKENTSEELADGFDSTSEHEDQNLQLWVPKESKKDESVNEEMPPEQLSKNFNMNNVGHTFAYSPGNFEGNIPQGKTSYDFVSNLLWSTTDSDPEEKSLVAKRDSKELELKKKESKIINYGQIILKDVKVKEVAATSFSIRNDTPIHASMEVDVINFPPNAFIKIDDVMKSSFCESSLRDQEKMECYILPGNGIVIFVSQHLKDLKPHESLDVDILVYANTWGTYYDTVVCKVTGLPPFYIQLIANVIGSPVYFAMAPPDVISQYPLRFGTSRYGSNTLIRSVKIINESCINLTITWHIFVKEQQKRFHEEGKEVPFSVVIDVYTMMKKIAKDMNCAGPGNNFCKPCKTTSQERKEIMEINIIPYMGKEEYTSFEVSPKETFVESKASQWIDVSFKPPVHVLANNKVTLCAHLIGFIKVLPQDIYSKYRFHRSHGKSISPIWAPLHAEVEMPQLSLESSSDDLEFFMEASKVCSHPNKEYSFTQVIIVKNNFQSPITALVDIEKPFAITEINTITERTMRVLTEKKEDIVFTLLPEECAEIHIACNMTQDYLIRIQEAFWYATDRLYSKEELDKFSQKKAIIECPLQLVQPHIMEQSIKISLFIEFPILVASTQRIDFGPVFIGLKKWIMFEVSNETASHVWFYASKVYQTNEFALKPSCGVLAPAPVLGRTKLQIKVTFSPTECSSYMDYIKIETCIPGDERIVVVEGVGTTDTKFETDF